MIRGFILCGLFFVIFSAASQDSTYTVSYLKRSSSFAWTTLGFDVLSLAGGSTEVLENGIKKPVSFTNSVVPRVTIGGVHFWGHADFYVTFPLPFSIRNTPSEFSSLAYTQRVETGTRLYPFKLKQNRLSPFVGISRRLLSFTQAQQESDFETTPTYQKMISPVQVGLTYTTSRYLVTASAYIQKKQAATYFITPVETAMVKFNPVSLNLAFLWYWDTDKNASNKKEVEQYNRKYEVLRKENRLSAWYWGIGPSTALQMDKSAFIEANYPYLKDDYLSGFMPDITFGRFFDNPDMNIGLSYRTYATRARGFDTDLRMRRHSVMIEAYKNLFNWLGFVPFVGVTGSIENLRTRVHEQLHVHTIPAFGFIAGWDIRVTKTGTSLLRTNLRYIPDLHMKIDERKVMYNHLEFNFIQFVHFIGRKEAYLKCSK